MRNADKGRKTPCKTRLLWVSVVGTGNGTGNCGYSPEITKQELFVTSVLQTRELEIHRTSTECHYIFRTSANMFFL